MSRSQSAGFCPTWTSAPGDTIADVIVERGLSESELARELNHSMEEFRALLEGRATITIAVARKLHHTIGGSVEFWISRDQQYREVAAKDAIDSEVLRAIPLSDMVKFGWLQQRPRPSEELETCCRFFDVPDLSALIAKCSSTQLIAYRKSEAFESWPAATAAWLRQGEIESAKITCADWNPAAFRDCLPTIRSLTRDDDPQEFLPELQKRCTQCGVAVVVVRSPAGCRASGAARFIRPNKAVLQLSFRYLTDDHLWFTFYHEAGHLLLHLQPQLFRDSAIYLEGADHTSSAEEEEEANRFAQESLIPQDFQEDLLRLPKDARAIMRFAKRIGISRGIVVGQLQYVGRIRQNHMNALKTRYTWDKHGD